MSEFIGPALPPSFQQDSPESPPNTSSYGPSPPPSVSLSSLEVRTRAEPSGYGPSLPPQFESDSVSEEDDGHNVLGPSLPPGYGFGGSKEREDERGAVAGPMLPPGFEGNIEEEEDSVIGPLPAHRTESDEERARIREEFESRSKAMKDKLTGKDKEGEGTAQREGWMLELPKKFKPSGVGPRKFRTGVTDLGDRSVWTDTPADKLRKARKVQEKAPKKETKVVQRSARDKKLEVFVNDHNEKNRPASLMSLHRKRRADDLKEKGGSGGGEAKERRPFDRDIDLEVRPNLVTPAKRKALMKDSKYSLDSKFTHGSSSFL